MLEEVILKKDVRKLGDRGELVKVAPGYARNFLYPQRLAMPATAANKKQLDEMRAAASRESERLVGDASQQADTLKGVTVRAVARAGESGTLFGSITTRDIANLITEQGHQVDRHQIILGSPLKETGDYEVRVHLYKDISVSVKVEVRAEGREDELFGEEREAAKQAVTEAAIAEAEAQAAAQAKAESESDKEAAEDAGTDEAVSEIEAIEQALEQDKGKA